MTRITALSTPLAIDQLYVDNSDPKHDYGVWISRAPVPEPGTWAMFAAGLGAMGWRAGRRRAA